MTVDGVPLLIATAELHLPYSDGVRLMYLRVEGRLAGDSFDLTLGEIELPLLRAIEELDGHRIHVRFTGRTFKDDTLATDITAMLENDISPWTCSWEAAKSGELLIDFKRIEGSTYRCRVDFWWRNRGDRSRTRCTAEFTVAVDEVNPLDEKVE